ncbi:MAG: dihydroxyacetone kinase subunit L [Methylococcaceae bacterium]|nr:MAG: dihydroxyacetone kinase subunit L [Methylococcaceae bacterium]
MTVSPALIPDFIQAVTAAIDANAEEVTLLDQAIGDGDHVTNLQRGLTTLGGLAPELSAMDWSAALQKIGMSLMSSMGGASGALFGTLFLAMSKAMRNQAMELATLAEALTQGVEAVKLRGKADLGDKTLLDVLIPVAATLKQAATESWPLPQVLENIPRVAAAGVEATRDLPAGKGRASFLGERARGHLDAGAKTSQLIIQAITRVLEDATTA